MKTKDIIISAWMLLVAVMAQAQQVKIGGNVYGGGNAGDMTGSTNVTVYAGELNEVYGGARMADVGGRTFVHIDGKHASDEIFIQNVYGGNDISGKIGESGNATTIPDEIEDETVDNTWKAFVRTTASAQTTETIGDVSVTGDSKMLVVGTLFGGGNGDYTYGSRSTTTTGENPVTTTTYFAKKGDVEVATSTKEELRAPELSKTYLEIKGGCIAHVYGGGNNATVTGATTININNESSGLLTTAAIFAKQNSLTTDAVITYLKEKVSMPDTQSDLSSFNYNHARVFGGNNKAVMSIMPKWNLQKGIVRDLYSGGNEGHMTSKDGLLVDIKEGSTIIVDNLFGGCRKADVHPMNNGVEQDHVYSPEGYNFPKDLAARVIVKGGDVNNVYGGNDISGKVHFGSAVGINTSIRGNVYGGGNGFYAYTDNPALKNDAGWRDFYYNPNEILSLGYTGTDEAIYANITAQKSVEALNKFRPNAEQVSIHITGTEGNPTIIGGSVFVGGNCATLKPKEGYEDPLAELKIGSYVIADKVFLGNNGEKMVDVEGGVLQKYAGSVTVKNASNEDVSVDFSKMDLTVSSTFAEYMEGVTMEIEPSVKFDNLKRDNYPDYIDYSSSIGSFYCGGNVGSMRSKNSVSNITFDNKVIIFDKLVGGCNSANVEAHDGLNAAYQGGLIGDPDSDGNRLILNLSGLKIQPKRWAVQRDPETYEKILTNGKVTYLTTTGDHPHRYLEWNTVDNSVYDTTTKTFKEVPPVTEGEYTEETAIGSTSDDIKRRLFGGNVYGGCYDSGIVNGNVVINIQSTIVDREDDDPSDDQDYGVFDSVIGDSEGEAILYASNDYKITKRRTGVILDEQGMDVFGHALNVFGGGHGKDTEIWGSTTINLTRGYTFQIFGGSEEGVIGKPIDVSEAANGTYNEADGTYVFNNKTLKYDPKYSCYINVMGKNAGVSKQADHSEAMAEAEFIYGGGFFGPIAGNTVINMGKGRVFNAFAGSCNADILGHTETYVGRMPKDDYMNIFPNIVKDIDDDSKPSVTEATVYTEGFPWIRDYIYGGNDLGGKILGNKDFIGRVSDFAKTKMYTPSIPEGSSATKTPVLTKANAYVEYLQGRADGLFGGCYGTYDYTDPKFKEYFYTTAETAETLPSGVELEDILGDPKPGNSKPHINNAFVNFRPAYIQTNNVVKTVFGAGQGQSGEKERDILQNRSYVLIDIPDDINDMSYYKGLEVFGAGAWGGVGMKFTPSEAKASPDSASAIIDLMRGTISAAYGGSFKEGITRRTVVNVPKLSTINITNIFGGAYGFMETKKVGENTVQVAHNEVPCDVYEANVNFSSDDAFVTGAIYGGNNACRRTVFGKVNINSTVHSNPTNLDFQGNVYGAGYGKDSWSHYTEVNLNRNAKVYYVYGGGNAGKVLNDASFHTWAGADIYTNMGAYNVDDDAHDAYMSPSSTNPMISPAKYDGKYYNTNVHLKEGATITGYGFGGGHGAEAVVSGIAYFDILGGTAEKDVSGSGRSGDVKNLYEKKGHETFTAKTMVYVEGGTARNVYASGWRGSVGRHNGDIDVIKTGSDESLTDYTTYNDVDGEANVVIGKIGGTSYLDGIPAITRNVYGGGEGGSVFGTTNVTINKGYIGYRYNPDLSDNTATTDIDERYVEELVDGDQSLEKGGNVFGGGYVANSYVDNAVINMYGGQVRGSIYGGGEIGPVGRGTAKTGAPTGIRTNNNAQIYKGGSTQVYLYGGHVMRNVFGGGRGQDNWGGDGTKLMSTYMTAEEIAALDLSSKGFVFGSTDVHIRGGEVGTAENALHGYGNVFGGGDEGFVYSATGTKASDTYYKNAGKLTLDCNVVVEPYCLVKPENSVTFDEYQKETDGSIKLAAANAALPGLPIKNGQTVTFNAGDYVPTEYLLQLKNKSADSNEETGAQIWGKLNVDGVTIHNAVFAGGNIATGSDIVKAETPTVYGNAAASLRDIFNRDLISVGTDEIGGLYGDGNLTLVDGFRELHIDNYGTDFYNLSDKVDKDVYDQMSQREKDYYQLKYVAKGTHTYEYFVSSSLHTDEGTGIAYKKGQKVTEATYNAFDDDEKENWNPGTKNYSKDDEIEDTEWALMDPIEQTNWKQDGIFSKYAGRPLNTIQRADMCGVYGSRMVLNGAQDRASEEVDYNDYTINRVGEVSLNQRRTLAVTFPSESTFEGLSDIAKNEYLHGNYFGIYNTVKFLGNLTSDVHFTDKRVTNVNENTQAPKADGKSYYDFKLGRPTDKYRNNGTSFNKVALASGVYLEIKREETEKTGTDVWGYITGIVELDLINVMQGMGGGYVYAKNEHGTKTTGSNPLILLNYNADVASYREFNYTESDLQLIETSGNFIHNTKQIVDDCYPNTGMYSDGYVASPAHYWYIRGQIYVYDQYISAFTGVANAYAEKVELPLTISAASNGRMTLREVQPNYYAYYDKNGMKLGDYEEKLTVNGKTYKLNDPISYWDYRLLSDADKEKFVEETYTTIAACTINGISYPAGYTMQPGPASQAGTYEYIKASALTGKLKDTDTKSVKYVLDEDNNKVAFDFVFRKSNNISHDQGYILTYEVNNPEVWNSYYTKSANRNDKINTKEFTDGKRIVIENDEEVEQPLTTSDYYKGPTFSLKSGVAGGIFGQREYKTGEIVNTNVYNKYMSDVLGNVTYTAVPTGTTLTKGKTYYTSDEGTGAFIANGEETATGSNYFTNGQALVEEAYIVTSQVSVMDDEDGDREVQRLYPGAVVSRNSRYLDVEDNNMLKPYSDTQWNTIKGHLDQYVDEEDGLTKPRQARVCTSLLKFSTSDYVYTGQPLSTADIDELVTKIKEQNTGMTDAEALAELNKYMSNAFLCYEGGDYGGQNFAQGQAYRALDTWSALSEKDRKSFTFNYDAFDLFVDSTYSYRSEENYGKQKVQYDGYKLGTTTTNATTGAISGTPLLEGDTPLNPAIYSVTKPVDYQAVFVGYKESDETATMVNEFSYTDEKNKSHTITKPTDINDQDEWLSREEYEDIPNERHHYSPIEVKEPRTYYVVKKAFMRGDVPYTVGQVIDVSTFTSLNDQQKEHIDQLDFTAEGLTDPTPTPVVDKDNNPVLDSEGHQVYEYDPFYYYYCREPYTINEKGEGKPVKALMANANGRNSNGETVTISKDAVITSGEVPAGFVIRQGASNGTDQYTYNSLVNKQKGFVIHGTAPTETSTLYVSSGSDIYNLQKEKIITVIYLYEYEESDETGNNVTPVSERHIVNIHINFESGVPEVGELHKPDIVYPGTSLTLDVPSVSEGAYRVTDSGWELFYQESDANTHTNGIPYTNGVTPVYWYQNNYWIAYYAQTYLGKTYSNSVQVSVANAHDLKSVMNHPQHYYIDHKDVDREPKIYINDYSSSGGNGLDMLKSLYDLSLLGDNDVTTDANGLIDKIKENGVATSSDSPFKGQALLDERVKAGQGLEFFLHTDLDGSTASEAEPTKNALIAGSTDGTTYEPCFSGRLHGEGHYISGLTKSLFGNLCGSVYNLGVMGTFTGAGIAETGSGYVENCWISTSSTEAKTSMPVFGTPTGLTTERPYRIVNCYYQEEDDASNKYTNHSSTYGIPTKKPKQAFYNGEVAYDLNGFYLFKRYADGSGQSTGLENKYYTYEDVTDPSKTTSTEPRTGHYGTPDATLSSSGVSPDLYYPSNGYVEDRFQDGDFRYADCKTIPIGDNPRAFKYMDGAVEKTIHYPVWPDDYIFFGQDLSYGHVIGRTHQEVPSSIVRTDGFVDDTSDGNRVYRAPAYFRSSEMKTAYFNPDAVFAQTKKGDATTLAYKNMTAVDFTDARFGTNDTYKVYDKGDVSVTLGTKTTKAFYPPLLDDDGLTGFRNVDLTANLLVYTMTGTTAADKTNTVVSAYLDDPKLSDYESNDKYRKVAVYDHWSNALRGHWVQLLGSAYKSTRDHLLIDKQDFNAPISYTFDSSHRMWYQREPNIDNFVDRTKGWDAVSLPFSAELVSTQDKGEITHFYSGSQESANGTGTKIGHEYWLREFDKTTAMSLKSGTTDIVQGNFKYPSGTESSSTAEVILKKDVMNTFLWDYYYVGLHDQEDMNKDTYQSYYSSPRSYTSYPMVTKGTPYIIGLPGPTYYEFDLSGVFKPTTTDTPNPLQLEKQTITFASQKGATIGVSDDEMINVSNTYSGNTYTFKPSYLNESFAAGSNIYTLQSEFDSDNVDGADCSSFVKVPNAPGVGDDPVPDIEVAAFRPYFMSEVVSGARPVTRAIVFNNDDSQLQGVEEKGDPDGDDLGKLKIYTRKHKIFVESALTRDIDIRILNAAGITISTFTLEPGETVETRIINAGVYIVQSADNRYIKKLAVK